MTTPRTLLGTLPDTNNAADNTDKATDDTAHKRQAPLSQPADELFVGAFPAWDLLPKSGFVRRVRSA
ncbi:MAG: hypothetical protein Q4G13_07835 [Moraxella sp.]|nr:hypothetical protein [Moraxella sp.]